MQDNNSSNNSEIKITRRIKCNKLPTLEIQKQQQQQQNNEQENVNDFLVNNKNLIDLKKSIFRFSMTSISSYELEQQLKRQQQNGQE
jgi:hypothetical protein